MRIPVKTLAVTATLVVGLATASVLHAHETHGSDKPMMGSEMMGQGGMMGMMSQMGEMMEGCNKMMQSMHQSGSGRPNEQWREESPGHKDKPNTGG